MVTSDIIYMRFYAFSERIYLVYLGEARGPCVYRNEFDAAGLLNIIIRFCGNVIFKVSGTPALLFITS